MELDHVSNRENAASYWLATQLAGEEQTKSMIKLRKVEGKGRLVQAGERKRIQTPQIFLLIPVP